MPQERENQFPHVTHEEWQKIRDEHDPASTAARAVVARHITGVPRRAFLLGDNDHSVVMRGVTEFMAAVIDMLDSDSPTTRGRVQAMMEAPDGLQD